MCFLSRNETSVTKVIPSESKTEYFCSSDSWSDLRWKKYKKRFTAINEETEIIIESTNASCGCILLDDVQITEEPGMHFLSRQENGTFLYTKMSQKFAFETKMLLLTLPIYSS